MVCVLSVFFSFFLSFFLSCFLFFFYWYFPRQTLTNHKIGRERESLFFLVFHFHPLTNIHLIHRDFYHLFLLDLFVITMMKLVLLRYLHFIGIFMNPIKSELLILTFQSDVVRLWAHIKLSLFYYKANALTNWDLHPYPPATPSPYPYS